MVDEAFRGINFGWAGDKAAVYVSTSGGRVTKPPSPRGNVPRFVGQQAPIAAGAIRKGGEDLHGASLGRMGM